MRHHVINGEAVPFTSEEETAQDIIDADFAATVLPSAKLTKISLVDDLRGAKSSTSFTHGGRSFDAGVSAQVALNHAIAYGALTSQADVTTRSWTLSDNSTATLTWGELRAMATALFERNDALHGEARVHKDAINELASVAAVDAYDITVNWTI